MSTTAVTPLRLRQDDLRWQLKRVLKFDKNWTSNLKLYLPLSLLVTVICSTNLKAQETGGSEVVSSAAQNRALTQQLGKIEFHVEAELDWFPEGPAYRASDDQFFFAGVRGLTRLGRAGTVQEVLGPPMTGGVHFLPDDSVLMVGHDGLRRLMPDGTLWLLADGDVIGRGNDLSIGIYDEIYFSVPASGIYRLTAGPAGRLQKVWNQGCNGLEVDPSGQYLYVAGRDVQRYRIDIDNDTLGPPETVVEFEKDQRGGDGCAFDAAGNFYTMLFRTGTIRVIDPLRRKLVAEVPVGVAPASNLAFGGPNATTLIVTAGSPKQSNCQVLSGQTDIVGFSGHPGAVDYPAIRRLQVAVNLEALGGTGR